MGEPKKTISDFSDHEILTLLLKIPIRYFEDGCEFSIESISSHRDEAICLVIMDNPEMEDYFPDQEL